MKTVQALTRKLETLGDLHDIVRTMKALSLANVRQYEKAEEALRDYYRTVELGLHVVLADLSLPPPEAPLHGPLAVAAVVFGTDYGLCGRFNQTLCDHARQRLDTRGVAAADRLFLAVGGKAANCLEESGQPVQECLFTPGSAEGITDTVAHLLLKIDSWQVEYGMQQVWLFYNRRTTKVQYQPTGLHLLPLDLARFHGARESAWPSKVLPTHTMPATDLLSSLVRQYLFVSLFRACAESAASEHSARLGAMHAAEKNIDEARETTTQDYRRLRQETITAEILDVVTGYEVAARP